MYLLAKYIFYYILMEKTYQIDICSLVKYKNLSNEVNYSCMETSLRKVVML